jgi:hypothetical protein
MIWSILRVQRGTKHLSAPIATLPDKEYVSRDYRNHDEHPILDLETEQGKMLDEKPHASAPLFEQDKLFVCAR